MSAAADTFEVGKVWGPWFWYLVSLVSALLYVT